MLDRPVLLYDGSCAFCRAWVGRIRRWDRRNRLELLPASERFSIPDLPPLSDHDVDAAMHLVLPDGQVLRGGQAVPELLRLLPGGATPRLLFRIPGVSRLAGAGYDWVARRRHRFGCGAGACGTGAG
ncbi:MAG: thiol-disulfide oxidoreductase DCC family protein [Gemmatimonadota bacterium]